MKLNTQKTFFLMLSVICGLWLLHVCAVAITEKRLPETLNPDAPAYYTFWTSIKHFFKFFGPPTLLCLTYFLDRQRRFQEHENTFNRLFLGFITFSSLSLFAFAVVSPVSFVRFFVGRPYSLVDLCIAFFAQIVWLWLAGASYLLFRKRFYSYQSVFLSVLTILSAQLIWEFPLNIRFGSFATPITAFTLYLARFIPFYLLLAYGLIHKIAKSHYFPFIWIPGVVSFLILLFGVSPYDSLPFVDVHYSRAVWCVPFLIYAYLLTNGKKP